MAKIEQTPQDDAFSGNFSHPSQKPRRLRKLWDSPIVIAVVVLLAIGGGLVAYKSINDTESSTGLSYSDLQQYDLPGPSAGSGISFTKPSELSPSGEAENGKASFVQLTQTSDDNNSYVAVARISVLTAAYKTTPTQKDYEETSTALNTANTQSDAYKYYDSLNTNFAKTAYVEPTISVTVGKPTQFTNPSITQYAWVFPVSADDSSGATPHQTGKLVLIYSDKTYFRFLVMANDDIWELNSSTWDQILNSIKINQ
ncbi:MAG TPA: hypothetical protein VI336_00090 [Candidatus Saccharimonadales bacterium]|nr:hypothetical protein [Candidatus Saccharimonadales bacterium]